MRHASFVGDNPWFDMSNDDFDRRGKWFEGPPDIGERTGDGFAPAGRPSPCVTRVSIDPQRISTGDEEFPTPTT
jgi:hypothetical protein